MKLWIDDQRDPTIFVPAFGRIEGDGTDWVWAKNYDEAMDHLSSPYFKWTHMSFDHDLGPGQKTGYDLIKFIAEKGLWPTEYIAVHSANPVGVENMTAVIEQMTDFVAIRRWNHRDIQRFQKG
jgi:hypothetical protein